MPEPIAYLNGKTIPASQVAIGATDNDALNHIAFLMPDLESVMRLIRSELLLGWPIRDLYQGPRGATIDVHLFDK